MLISVASVLTVSIALPSGGGTVATRDTMPPMPSMVIFVLIVAKSLTYVPAATWMTSPSLDAAIAAAMVENSPFGPTVRIAMRCPPNYCFPSAWKSLGGIAETMRGRHHLMGANQEN